jgi:hypothetical protein
MVMIYSPKERTLPSPGHKITFPHGENIPARNLDSGLVEVPTGQCYQ